MGIVQAGQKQVMSKESAPIQFLARMFSFSLHNNVEKLIDSTDLGQALSQSYYPCIKPFHVATLILPLSGSLFATIFVILKEKKSQSVMLRYANKKNQTLSDKQPHTQLYITPQRKSFQCSAKNCYYLLPFNH